MNVDGSQCSSDVQRQIVPNCSSRYILILMNMTIIIIINRHFNAKLTFKKVAQGHAVAITKYV